MKLSSIIAVLVIAGAIYYYTDGGKMLGITQPTDLPDTMVPPNATFIGDEETNPYFTK
jgi:hypothetical protein